MRRLVISAGLRSFIRLFLAAFLLMLAERQGWLDFAEDGIERLLVPAESRVYKFSHVVRAPYQTLRYWRNGAARIADLERQVAELAVEAAQVRLLQEENRAMRQLLGALCPRSGNSFRQPCWVRRKIFPSMPAGIRG
jgi:cell shape-determining protein MreC